jgi:hypothetical protein
LNVPPSHEHAPGERPFAAFTGQCPQATIARLTAGQFRTAVSHKKPAFEILPEQDKIRMQHYCPLHPQVVDALAPLLDSQRNDEPMFKQLSFERWLKKQKIQLLHCDAHFVPGEATACRCSSSALSPLIPCSSKSRSSITSWKMS